MLAANTTYHFRITATDGTNTFVGNDMTFTTGPPATAPVATTQSASYLAPTAATLNASFETGTSPATVVFEYGTTTAYGSRYTCPTTFGVSATALTSVTYVLTGLTANTSYHYRVIVTNNEGSSTGQDASFTTLSLPSVTTGTATSVYDTVAVLNGTSNPQYGTYTAAFDYGLTTAYGQTVTSETNFLPNYNGGDQFNTSNTPPISIGGGYGGVVIGGSPQNSSSIAALLLPLTTYHFRLKLTDSYGISYYGSDASFTTLSSVQSWRQQTFNTTQETGSAADLAAPAGDGIPNLFKYAFNLDPATPGTLPQPQLKDYSGASHLSLTFQRDPAKTDLTYEVQAADSPAGPWTTLASSVGGAVTSGPGFVGESLHWGRFGTARTFITISLGNGGNTIFVSPGLPMDVEVKDTVSMQDATSRFMRLQVTRH